VKLIGPDEVPSGNVHVTVTVTIAAVGAIADSGTLIATANEPSPAADEEEDPRFTCVPPRSATALQVTVVPGTVTHPVIVTELRASTVGPPGAPPLGVRDSEVAAASEGVYGPPSILPNSGVVITVDVCAWAGTRTLSMIGFFQDTGANTAAPAATPRLRRIAALRFTFCWSDI